MKYRSSQSAFTLIELLVVIAIIGILSAVVLASLNTARTKANLAAGKQLDATLASSLGDQLIGSWSFRECAGTSTADNSGNNFTGTLIGAISWLTDTPYNQGCSLKFTSGSYVTLNDTTNSIFSVQPGTARTFSAWFKDSGLTGSLQQIIWKNGSCVGWEVYLDSNGKLNGIFTTPACGGTVNYQVASSGAYNDGNWHQVTLSIDRINGVLTLYADGKSIGSTAIDTTNIGTGGSFLIGDDWDYSQYFNGEINDVRVYATTLSLSEVQRLYTQQLGLYYPAK